MKGILQKLYEVGVDTLKSEVEFVPSSTYDQHTGNQVSNLYDFTTEGPGHWWWSGSQIDPNLTVKFLKRKYKINAYSIRTITYGGSDIVSFPTSWILQCSPDDFYYYTIDTKETDVMKESNKNKKFSLSNAHTCKSLKIIQKSNVYNLTVHKNTLALRNIDVFSVLETIQYQKRSFITYLMLAVIIMIESH